MRLLNTKTFEFTSVNDPSSVDYAILSHVWSKDGEQSYHDVLAIVTEATRESDRRRTTEILARISMKIRRCCARALADGYEYIWADSCCIDQTSSSELSEAINSMYKWYACASRCYAFLEDVSDHDNPHARYSQFRRSVWFTRGWTLQELIAPALVVFLSEEWNPIGTKHSLSTLIEQITSIDVDILNGLRSPSDVSVARRMSWAAKRRTTREEDMAYSLLGLFSIHMPTIYGEGRHAFIRLQEEILKQIPDDTLFTWGRRTVLKKTEDLQCFDHPCIPHNSCDKLFASSPSDFAWTADLRPIPHDILLQRLGLLDDKASHPPPTYTTTRFGVRAELPLLSFQRHRSAYTVARVKIGFLLCEDADGRLVALILRAASTYRDLSRLRDSNSGALLVGARIPKGLEKRTWLDHRLVSLTGDVVDHLRTSRRLTVSTVHISKGISDVREPRSEPQIPATSSRPPCSLVFPSWRKAALARQGLTIQETISDGQHRTDDGDGRRHIFVLSHPTLAVIRVTIDICMKTLSLRMQVQDLPSQTPITETLMFGDAVPSGSDVNQVQRWSQCSGPTPTSIWEYTLPNSKHRETVHILRLSITSSESPRDVVLTLDMELLERELELQDEPRKLENSMKKNGKGPAKVSSGPPPTLQHEDHAIVTEKGLTDPGAGPSRIPLRRREARRLSHPVP